MAWENPHDVLEGVLAGGDLTTYQDRLVLIDRNGVVVPNTVAGGVVDGVLINKPEVNQAASVAMGGRCIVVCGAAVTAGSLVASDTQARAVTAVTGDFVFGRALSSTSAPGEKLTVAVKNYGYLPFDQETQGIQDEERHLLSTLVAAEDLRTQVHTFVLVNSSGKVEQAGVAGDPVDGVLQNTPNTDEAATFKTFGVCVVVCGVAVTEGALVTSDSAGRAVTAAAGDFACGRALMTTQNQGDPLTILLSSYGYIPEPETQQVQNEEMHILNGMVAGDDLQLLQNTFVIINTDGEVVGNTVAGGPVDGVLLNAPDEDEAATVKTFGPCTVKCGAAVTAGSLVASDGSGAAITAAAEAFACGKALSTTLNPGESLSILLNSYGYLPAGPEE